SYEDVFEGSINVIGGGNSFTQNIIGRGFKIKKYEPTMGGITNRVTVTINLDGEDVDYDFDLKSGENFYFVISQDVEGRGRIVLDKPKGE
ncbi:hypothetical protein J4229_03905, partial [Candidatus Pacearchaeota archaeon]|nr:hypothetical protein [Candidatus Pacearchaeota archaeon]